MKRLLSVAALMLLSSSAYAGSSFSFVVGGHRIHIEAPSHRGSPSCVSVSIPGIYQSHGRDAYRDDTPIAAAPVAPPAPAPVVQPVAVRPISPAPAAQIVATAQQSVALPLPPVPQPIGTSQAEMPIEAPRPDAEAPRISNISHETDDDQGTPLGDWQTEGQKGSVRIERCGRALCGYVLDPGSSARGEAVLIGMKPKDVSKVASKETWQWSGSIYSRDSGNTYYATMVLKGQNSLRVEACALGHFFCSGNVWSRIEAVSARLVTYRQIFSQPES
jgi:hypothetical protein